MGSLFSGIRGCMYCDGECNTSCMRDKKNDRLSKKLLEAAENENFIINSCLSYRQDFLSLPEQERLEIIEECKKWVNSISNNTNLLS